MKKVSKAVAISLVAGSLVLTQGLYAKNSKSNQDKPTFALYDLNKDGKVTEQEFNKAREARMIKRANEGKQLKNVANAKTFSQIDINKNGLLEEEEFIQNLQKNSKNGKQSGNGKGKGQGKGKKGKGQGNRDN